MYGDKLEKKFYNEHNQLMSNFSDEENIGFNLMFRVINEKAQVLPDL